MAGRILTPQLNERNCSQPRSVVDYVIVQYLEGLRIIIFFAEALRMDAYRRRPSASPRP